MHDEPIFRPSNALRYYKIHLFFIWKIIFYACYKILPKDLAIDKNLEYDAQYCIYYIMLYDI